MQLAGSLSPVQMQFSIKSNERKQRRSYPSDHFAALALFLVGEITWRLPFPSPLLNNLGTC